MKPRRRRERINPVQNRPALASVADAILRLPEIETERTRVGRVALCMTEETMRTPADLRQMAERCNRLAGGSTDARAIDALAEYARELLEEAERKEEAGQLTAS